MKTRRPESLTTTGTVQPYISLQDCFQHEQIFGACIEPGFLDAPAFTATGHCFRYNDTVLVGKWPNERLS